MINLTILLSLILFFIGITIIISKKTVIMLLIGAEFMFNAGNLLLLTISKANSDPILSGEVFVLFNIALAAIEVAIGISIAILIYRKFKLNSIDEISELKG